MSDQPSPPRSRNPFSVSAELRRQLERSRPGIDDLSLQDLHEIKLVLRGESVVDWHRLYTSDVADVRRFLVLNGIDPDDPVDVAYIDALRADAVDYITNVLRLRIDDNVARHVEFGELFMIASGHGKQQRNACVLLKVMHIMHHLDARELRTQLALSDNELFSLVEESVTAMFDELRRSGVPVVEFAWSRKTRQSLVTKLLVKRETSAARVFDRLRFRLVVENQRDLGPTLHVMLHNCIPFNYIVPGETVNNLVSLDRLRKLDSDAPQPVVEEDSGSIALAAAAFAEAIKEPSGGHPSAIASASAAPSPASASASSSGAESPVANSNEFSSEGFRILNFISDLPVRVDDLVPESEFDRGGRRWGRVVFVLCEFQILDRMTAETNESGESSHEAYKQRQHARVKERLLRAPSAAAQIKADHAGVKDPADAPGDPSSDNGNGNGNGNANGR